MNLFDIENRTIDDLRRGYYFDGKYRCLHCELTCQNVAEMDTHQRQTHAKDSDDFFFSLLNADSILKLSHSKKSVYSCIKNGMSDSEIAVKLKMNSSTVRSHRRILREKYNQSKVMLMLCEMMDLDKQTDSAVQIEVDDLIPGLDVKGIFKGSYYTKAQVHDSVDPVPHSSILLLTAQRHSDGVMRFLVSAKSSKMLTIAGKVMDDSDQLSKRWVDIQGSQCRKIDCSELEMDKPLPDTIYTNASKRTLEQEVYLKSDFPDASKLMYLYTDKTSSTGSTGQVLYPHGCNIETSKVYLYRLKDDIPRSSIMVRDSWIDSLGGSKPKRYPSLFVTWEELEGFASSSDTALMNGALRVVERVRDDPSLKAKMFDMLDSAEM